MLDEDPCLAIPPGEVDGTPLRSKCFQGVVEGEYVQLQLIASNK